MNDPDPNLRDGADVRKMFSRIAPVYDTVNRAMCFGLDTVWRKRLARSLARPGSGAGKTYADIACGSGDVALEIAKRFPKAKVVGLDFCAPMLEIARRKLQKYAPESDVSFAEADCENLPLENGSLDGATVAFGFRNFRDRAKCLREIARVLKPGAKLAILEVARAPRLTHASQKIFMRKFVPFVASMLGGAKRDYGYLAETTLAYPPAEEIEKMFSDAGFEAVSTRNMAFGLIAITSGSRRAEKRG